MPAYVYRCPNGHEFEFRMTYDEFDMLRDNPDVQSKLLCEEIIQESESEYEDQKLVKYCLGLSSIQIQPTPFKIKLLEE